MPSVSKLCARVLCAKTRGCTRAHVPMLAYMRTCKVPYLKEEFPSIGSHMDQCLGINYPALNDEVTRRPPAPRAPRPAPPTQCTNACRWLKQCLGALLARNVANSGARTTSSFPSCARIPLLAVPKRGVNLLCARAHARACACSARLSM